MLVGKNPFYNKRPNRMLIMAYLTIGFCTPPNNFESEGLGKFVLAKEHLRRFFIHMNRVRTDALLLSEYT